jgi:hypothetical protein
MSETARHGLIQLAGRQILPNLWMALTLQKHGMLSRHEVIHSDDKRESADPAEQLVRLVGQQERVFPNVEPVEHVLDETEPTLWHTRHTALAIMDEAKATGAQHTGWILHVTGGNKPMSSGATQLAGDPRVQAVVYRNIDNVWWVVERESDGELRDRRVGEMPVGGRSWQAWERALLEDPARLHDVPLNHLLAAQFDEHRDDEAVHGNSASHQTPNLASWLQSAMRRRGGFADHARTRRLGPHSMADGDAFECFVAHILSAARAQRVLWGVHIYGRDRSKIVETDVVACSGDRLAFYDLKIDRPDASGKTAQIRTAHNTARTFGGLSARAVMVRPNWPASPPVEDFAEALGVKLLNRRSVSTLIHDLLEPLGLQGAQSAELHELHLALQRLPPPPSAGPALPIFFHRPAGAH